jgi:ABC-type amino acid transport substrate-binding protein
MCFGACAERLTLRVPEVPYGQHHFYVQLLDEALRAAGHEPSIEVVPDLPHPRIWLMLQSGELDVFWSLPTVERSRRFAVVNNDLTNGLTGQRLLLIPQGEAGRYAHVNTLADFRATGARGGFGPDWYDAQVWAANDLPFDEIRGYRSKIYAMLRAGDRRLDYFPRGADEIVEEARSQPGLAIEPRLLLVYPLDFRYHLALSVARYRPLIEDALRQAERSGLKKRLIATYFGAALAQLGLDKRVRIPLKLPASE